MPNTAAGICAEVEKLLHFPMSVSWGPTETGKCDDSLCHKCCHQTPKTTAARWWIRWFSGNSFVPKVSNVPKIQRLQRALDVLLPRAVTAWLFELIETLESTTPRVSSRAACAVHVQDQWDNQGPKNRSNTTPKRVPEADPDPFSNFSNGQSRKCETITFSHTH